MRKNMNLLSLTFAITLSALACGCSKKEVMHPVTEIMSHVFEVPTYTELDENYADNYYANTYDTWEDADRKGGGCSAIKTTLDDGTIAIGRNLDLNISNKCAYIVRTNVPHKYSTFGLTYTFRDVSPDYQKVKDNGNQIDDNFYKLLPFMCDDVMNESGLYIEINMRNGEYWPTGEDKFSCSGTNENAAHRVYVFSLCRYIAENCATLADAKEYLKTLNVYSKKYYWNYAFLICDRFGNSSVLEFGMNEYRWNDDKICHTNFYLDSVLNKAEKIYSGLGRYETLTGNIGNVHTKSDLFDLMKSVNYYQVYDPRKCKFDPRSEDIGVLPYATYELIFDEEYKEHILDLMEEFGNYVRSLSRQQQQDLNKFWESSYTAVVDLKNRDITLRFFENDMMTAKINQKTTIVGN